MERGCQHRLDSAAGSRWGPDLAGRSAVAWLPVPPRPESRPVDVWIAWRPQARNRCRAQHLVVQDDLDDVAVSAALVINPKHQQLPAAVVRPPHRRVRPERLAPGAKESQSINKRSRAQASQPAACMSTTAVQPWNPKHSPRQYVPP